MYMAYFIQVEGRYSIELCMIYDVFLSQTIIFMIRIGCFDSDRPTYMSMLVPVFLKDWGFWSFKCEEGIWIVGKSSKNWILIGWRCEDWDRFLALKDCQAGTLDQHAHVNHTCSYPSKNALFFTINTTNSYHICSCIERTCGEIRLQTDVWLIRPW